MSTNEKPFVPSVTTSTLGDRLEALRSTQQGYEDDLPARLAPYLPTGEPTDEPATSDREFPSLPGRPVVKEGN
jgi:hypothetical protein